jgi:hypothetical protein
MGLGSPPGFDDMTVSQKALLFRIQEATGYGCWPSELRPALINAGAAAEDKAAVARFLGGRGADREFLS